MAPAKHPRRTRVERGVHRQPNGNYAVCARHAGRLHFRTVGCDLPGARRAREELVAALTAGRVPASPRLRFDTVAGWRLERFEAKVAGLIDETMRTLYTESGRPEDFDAYVEEVRTAHKPKRNLMKLMAGLDPVKSTS